MSGTEILTPRKLGPGFQNGYIKPIEKTLKEPKDNKAAINNIIEKTQVKQLTQQFFTEMLRLELQMANKKFTINTIEELVQLYAKAIEYYDSLKDPISLYFLEKIQITLASKNTLKIIVNTEFDKRNSDMNKNQSNSNKSTDYPTQSIVKSESKLDSIKKSRELSDNDDDNISNGSKEDVVHDLVDTIPKENYKPARYSITKVRVERAKQVDRYIKLETQKYDEHKNMTTLLEKHMNSAISKDKLVRRNLNDQHFRMKQKIKERKFQAHLSKSKNPDDMIRITEKMIEEESFTLYDGSYKKSNSRNLDLILDELDLNDDDASIHPLSPGQIRDSNSGSIAKQQQQQPQQQSSSNKKKALMTFRTKSFLNIEGSSKYFNPRAMPMTTRNITSMHFDLKNLPTRLTFSNQIQSARQGPEITSLDKLVDDVKGEVNSVNIQDGMNIPQIKITKACSISISNTELNKEDDDNNKQIEDNKVYDNDNNNITKIEQNNNDIQPEQNNNDIKPEQNNDTKPEQNNNNNNNNIIQFRVEQVKDLYEGTNQEYPIIPRETSNTVIAIKNKLLALKKSRKPTLILQQPLQLIKLKKKKNDNYV